MMPGMIMLWYGSPETIPSGWHECDGTMGTPDLRDVFVRGAYPGLPTGSTGGTASHRHDFTGDGHAHGTVGDQVAGPGPNFSFNTDVQPAVGTTDYGYHFPPFHSLHYIMKL